jgi:hypothetical protein
VNRLKRAKEVGLGVGNSTRRHFSDADAVTAARPFVADHADKNNSAIVRAAEPGNLTVSDGGTELDPPFTPPAIPDLRGHDQRPDPLRVKTAEEFVAAMHAYKAWAGNPSLREMERRCAKQMSYTTFGSMLKSSSLPPKPAQVETFVKVLGEPPRTYNAGQPPGDESP